MGSARYGNGRFSIFPSLTMYPFLFRASTISGIFRAYFMCSHSVERSSSHHAVGVSPLHLK